MGDSALINDITEGGGRSASWQGETQFNIENVPSEI